ncbi:Phosphodiesterase [Aphelenchoides fujianensis]|nr:Phosphodiesterase [Aphelenchoides fujianensis]
MTTSTVVHVSSSINRTHRSHGTVTSATGLPTIAAEPSRPRSSNYWKPSSSAHQDSPEGGGGHKTSACVLHQHSVDSASKGAGRRSTQRHASDPSVVDNLGGQPGSEPAVVDVAVSSPKSDSSLSLDERRRSRPPPLLSPAAFLSSAAPSPFAKSPSLIKSPSPLAEQEEPESGSDAESEASTRPQTSAGRGDVEAADVQVVQTADGTVFDRAAIEKDADLKRMNEWSLPIFTLAERYQTSVLSRLSYMLFKQADLFSIFKISHVKFFNFFHALGNELLEYSLCVLSHHNRVHATDVLHACHYLCAHPVRAFLGRPPTPDDEDVEEGVEPLSFGPLMDSAPLPIATSMTPLELMALFTAAAAHDVDHPGRTNAFLVAGRRPKGDPLQRSKTTTAPSRGIFSAIRPNFFIETLDSAETKRFRYLVLEYILATDLKQHFDIILSFNDKAAEMDLTNESDRWTDRICQEFYEQGDEEKRR